MSYTIAKNIKFNKDFTTYKVNGACSNVTPKTFSYSKEHDDFYSLLSSLSGRGIQMHNTKKASIIMSAVRELERKAKAIGSDVWHLHLYRDQSLEELKEIYKEGGYNAKHVKPLIDNHGMVETFNREACEMFRRELIRAFEENKREDHIVKIGKVIIKYIDGLYKGGAYTTKNIERAKKFCKAQAEEIKERFEHANAEVIKAA